MSRNMFGSLNDNREWDTTVMDIYDGDFIGVFVKSTHIPGFYVLHSH